MNSLKYSILLIVIVLFVGCANSPNLSKDFVVCSKTTDSTGLSVYKSSLPAYGFLARTSAILIGPDSFANAGDTIGYRNGVIKVVKKRQKKGEVNVRTKIGE